MREEIFFDRNAYLQILQKHFNDLVLGYRQNLAFVGNELIGKTSLILKFLNEFHDERILPIYICAKKEELYFFAERFINNMLCAFLNTKGIEVKEEREYLLNRAEEFIPKTAKRIRELKATIKRKKETLFMELLSIVELLNKETDKFTVVILDEFHILEELGIKNLYRDWAKILVLQPSTMFVVISSSCFKTKRILGDNLNLLFGKFELFEVEPFDYQTSKEFLQDRLNGLVLEDKTLDFLVGLSSGVPFYLKMFSDSIYKIKSQNLLDTHIDKESVIFALLELLFDETGALNRHFHGYLNRFLELGIPPEAIRILYSISKGYNRLKDMIETLSYMQKKYINKMLHQMLQEDIISKNGDFYKVNDRLFGLWLKFVYQKKTDLHNFNFYGQRDKFKEELEKLYQEFVSDASKKPLDKLIEIMHLFENDYADIDNRKLKLVNFREIKPLFFSFPSINEGLLARANNYLWIIALNYHSLKEADIVEFVKECKKYKEKKQRKIIVTFQPLDINTQLRAKEEKIITWDIKSVNLLCELFNRPGIII